MKKKVLINTSSFNREHSEIADLESKYNIQVDFNPYGRRLTKEELLDLVCENTVGTVAGLEVFDQGILDKTAGKLKVISRCGTGEDNLSSLKKDNLYIFTTPDAPTQAVAELAVSLMLSSLRRIVEQHNAIVQGGWNRQLGGLLSGKKVGLIGFGRIGQRVAKLLSGFDATVFYYDTQETVNMHASYEPKLDNLIKKSDILSLHLPATDTTKNTIDAEFLGKIKNNVIIINTARGGLINETDLVEFLMKNTQAFAALDVFKKEPYEGELRKLPNVLLTPHIGSYAKEARMAMEKQALQNLIVGLEKSGVINGN